MASAGGKRKYLLFKADDGRPDHLKPCAFHFSPEGCRNGQNCRFSHDPQSQQAAVAPAPAPAPTPAPAPAPAPKIAKPEPKKPIQAPPQSKPVPPQPKKNVVQESDSDSSSDEDLDTPPPRKECKIAAATYIPVKAVAPAPAPVVALSAPPGLPALSTMEAMFQAQLQSMLQQQKLEYERNMAEQIKKLEMTFKATQTPAKPTISKPVSEEDDDTEFLFSAVNAALNQNQVTPSPAKGKKPIATPNTQPSADSQKGQKRKSSELNSTPAEKPRKAPSVTTTAAVSTPSSPTPVLPTVSAASTIPATKFSSDVSHLLTQKKLDWAELVQLTKANARFASDFSFDVDAAWVAAKPASEIKSGKVKDILALDCEMCQTEDPLTGNKDHSSLVRVSIVNGNNPDEILLDKLVRPTWTITDMRTAIHGIPASDVENATYTLRHAQADILALCSDKTIIVGHGLQNDMKALKLNHKHVVDTAMIYTLEGESHNCPSLRDVSEQILGTKMSETHDSVEDSRQALRAAVYLMSNGIPSPVVRKVVVPSSLLVHRIPEGCTEENISQLIMTQTSIVPKTVEKISRNDTEGKASTGRCNVDFVTPAHADLAFETIGGPLRPDKSNKPQKRLYLKGGGYICVRKI